MKEKIIYGISFLTAFIIVTLLMIYAASNYRNVFDFDFTPVDNNVIAKAANTAPVPLRNDKALEKLRRELIDSLHAFKEYSTYDTLSFRLKDTSIIDTLRKLLRELKNLKNEKSKKELVLQNKEALNLKSAKQDSAYKVWIKNTVKLYEAMDSKKAAKIIQNYSDNIARDIIFSMKKKKAAEIIAELKPEVANRIISVQ